MAAFLAPALVSGAPAVGPLSVSARNPRYFADNGGRAVYLTGSHNWYNLQDAGDVGKPVTHTLDFKAYLEFLRTYHHNFTRLWFFEGWEGNSTPAYYRPQPFLRTGPGKALDGKLKYDLEKFDEDYFKRLRERVIAARDQGVYVSVMIFNGWSVQKKKGNPWPGHPFNAANNINGIDGDANRNGEGEEVHTLAVPAVTRVQESYVRQVIDTVNDLDNVLYEIANESAGSKEWQYHFVRYIKHLEQDRPKRHPVGMTVGWPAPGVDNRALFEGPADWVSPNADGGYKTDPPAADGGKVILSDTDHLWGEGGGYDWVWKSFCRGLNPIYMDRVAALTADPSGEIPEADGARKAMGNTCRFAARIDLLNMTPRPDLASTGYCLAAPGREYLVYFPEQREASVDLTGATGSLAVEWLHPIDPDRKEHGVITGGNRQTFKPPFEGAAVLHLSKHPKSN